MIHKTTRSILSVLLAALLLVTSIPLTPAFADGGAVPLQSESGEGRGLTGDGTKSDPYQIGSADDLRAFAEKVNGGKTDANTRAELTDDIDLNNQSWYPIGTSSSNPYEGTFNGDGHTISGLYIDSDDNDQGLFGYVSGSGKIENLSVSGSVSVSGSDHVGGVVGLNLGTVINCAFSGSVSGTGDYVGGVVGDNDGGRVENCYNTGEVSGNSYVGGVVGYNIGGGRVTNSYNTGAVSGLVSGTGSYVGGVVGHNSGSIVENCYNTGEVSGPDRGNSNYVGGVVGYNDIGTVTNSYNIGNVSGPDSGSDNSVGGVVGQNNFATVTGCYFLTGTAEKGIGNGSGDAAVVDNLDALCKALESNPTWTISDTLNRPVLKDNHEDDGSEDHPYEIFTATQLENFRDLVNKGSEKSAHAKLMNNIDLSSVCGAGKGSWNPIGNSIDNSYEGTFNGDGHTIRGLYIDSSDNDYKGLFGRVNGGTVQDLSVSGDINGKRYVGGVVGYNNGGTVTGCIFSGSGSVSGKISVGGVVGLNSGSNGVVENCYNTGKVSGPDSGNISGDSYVGGVGGVVGYNGGTVENSYNTGKVTGSADSSDVGGVVGWNSGNVENCYNTGSVTSSGNPLVDDVGMVGGVVGYNSSSVGGDNRGSVENCYNTGSVSDGTYTGGVVGWNDGANVTNCYFLQTADVNVGRPGIGKGSGDATEKDDTAFHSGEVAWLLENVQTDGSSQVWGQNIGEDKSPVLTSDQEKTVYRVPVDLNYTGAQADQVIYTNSTLNAKEPTREGYTFDGWYDSNGNPVTAITATTVKLYAHWTAVEDPDPEPEEPPYTGKYSYEIATDIGDNGALSVDRYATEGEKVTITVTPDEAYLLDDLVVTAGGKDVELVDNGDGTFSFTMPSADVKISATFAEDPDWTEPEEPATDVSDIFLDVAPNAWYKDAVQYAYDNGLMTGVSATEFAPEATTTRAMIVSILARLEGVTTAQAAGFNDVNDNDWYATAVNWAANVGVVNGYEDNTFQPNTAITREQLAAILMNYAAYKGEDVSNRADLTSYTDQPSAWATETMSWAVAEGLITGVTADTLQPQGAATRAQVAAILQRFLSE